MGALLLYNKDQLAIIIDLFFKNIKLLLVPLNNM